jgi:hypothetical protein
MEVQKEATRLYSLAAVFVWLGWIGVAVALISLVLYWIDLVGRDNINFIEAFFVSSWAIGAGLFTAIVLAAVGHALRLFAAYALSKGE